MSQIINNFYLNDGETLKRRCAEIFLTSNSRLVLNCLLCCRKYEDYGLFKEHLEDDHSLLNTTLSGENIEDSSFDANIIECLEEYSTVEEESVIKDDDNILSETLFIQPEELEEDTVIKDEAYFDNCTDDVFSLADDDNNKDNSDNVIWTIMRYEKSPETLDKESTPPQINEDLEFLEERDTFVKHELDDLIVEDDSDESWEKIEEKITHKDVEEYIDETTETKTKKLTRRLIDTARKRKVRPNNSNSERKHVCPICSFAFVDKSNLNSHIKRHGDDKKFACTECPKKFFTRTEYNTHVRWHTGERPYICSSCGKGCLTAGELTVHERRHTNDRRYKCEYCGKSFFNNKHLKDHIVSHTQERNYICNVCNSRFLRRKSLASHLKIHANKREYVCNICGNAYNQKPALSIHIKSKHGVQLHKQGVDNNISSP